MLKRAVQLHAILSHWLAARSGVSLRSSTHSDWRQEETQTLISLFVRVVNIIHARTSTNWIIYLGNRLRSDPLGHGGFGQISPNAVPTQTTSSADESQQHERTSVFWIHDQTDLVELWMIRYVTRISFVDADEKGHFKVAPLLIFLSLIFSPPLAPSRWVMRVQYAKRNTQSNANKLRHSREVTLCADFLSES